MLFIRGKAFLLLERGDGESLNDSKIVDLYLARDEAAIKHTSEKYGVRLRRMANAIVEDMSTAEECENDTYLRAWNAIPPHEPRDYLFAFLARINRNLALNLCKERKSLMRNAFICELSAEMEQCIPGSDGPERQVDAIVLTETINQFLGTLSTEKRKVFVSRYWCLDSIETISRRYGLSESKVKSILFRCRNQLRVFLNKEGYQL